MYICWVVSEEWPALVAAVGTDVQTVAIEHCRVVATLFYQVQ